MNAKRRPVETRNLELESLDARVVPSAMAIPHGPAWHAAVMFHQAVPANHHPSSLYASTFAMRATPSFAASAARLPIGYHTVVAPRLATPTFHYTIQAPKVVTTPTPNNPTPTPPRIVVTPTVTATSTTTTGSTSTSTDVGDVQNGPLAKAGQYLIAIYQQFEQSGSVTAAQSALIEISGSSVGVDIRTSGDPNALATQLTSMGMQVNAIDATTHTVEGLLPINQLLNVAQRSDTVSITPIFRPKLM